MMPGIIISFIFSKQGYLILRTSSSQNQLACEPQAIDDAAHWFCIQVGAADLPRGAWSYLFAFQQSCLDQSFDAAKSVVFWRFPSRKQIAVWFHIWTRKKCRLCWTRPIPLRGMEYAIGLSYILQSAPDFESRN
jgi:hypothetical protein